MASTTYSKPCAHRHYEQYDIQSHVHTWTLWAVRRIQSHVGTWILCSVRRIQNHVGTWIWCPVRRLQCYEETTEFTVRIIF